MTQMVIERFRAHLSESVDPAGLALFRILFGLLMFGATVRFWSYGWIDSIYLRPEYHFTYDWFSWIQVPDPMWLYGVFACMALSSLAIAFGVYTPIAAAVFWLTFTYAELLEKAAYLNHYYLVSLLAFLLIFIPTDTLWSVRSTSQSTEASQVSRGSYWCLRAQISLVYFFAGFAKINEDWLVHAQPLSTWLQNYAHLPLVGPVLTDTMTAYVMSWVGCLFDLTVWAFLMWRPTRNIAAVIAIFFHIAVWLLFPIGVFSWVMILVITLFFEPTWPRRFMFRSAANAVEAPQSVPSGTGVRTGWLCAAMIWLIIQCLIPLRFLAYQGPVNWTEEGFRFSWRVMLIEKTGMLEYRIETENPRRSLRVHPREKLTELQFKMLVTQPDMIIQYARFLADEYDAMGAESVRVYADSFVAFNGRPSQRYIRDDLNLADPEVTVGDAVLPMESDSP